MKKVFKHSKFTAVFTDENGYFSFTGDCDGGSGAVGNKIAEIEPRFKLLNDMHLSNAETGAPMHDWANAEYYFKNGKMDTLEKHLHVSEPLFKRYVQAQTAIVHEVINAIPNTEINITDLRIELENVMDDIKDEWEEQAQEVYDLVDKIESNLIGAFVNPFDDNGNYISDEYENHLDGLGTEEQNKIIALAMHEDIDVCEVDQTSYGDHSFETAGRSYLVVTDNEGDELWDEDLENYIDDCLEIPEKIMNYFDREAWKNAARVDGRAHSLARYDGNEYTETVGGETYYIYRQ